MNTSDTKRRIIALERLFIGYGTLSIKQIQKELFNQYDIEVDRKTLYSDIAVLTEFYRIETDGKGKSFIYILDEREM